MEKSRNSGNSGIQEIQRRRRKSEIQEYGWKVVL
jgi:hypothetical protein